MAVGEAFAPHASCRLKGGCMGDGSCLAALTLEQELRYAIQGRVGNALEYQIKNLTCEHPDAIKILSAAIRFLAIYGFS